MRKIRVYEMAKELGVESKVVMQRLESMGEYVRSASTIIEAPVAAQLRAGAFPRPGSPGSPQNGTRPRTTSTEPGQDTSRSSVPGPRRPMTADGDPGQMTPDEHERLLSRLRAKPRKDPAQRSTRGWYATPRRPPARRREAPLEAGSLAAVLYRHSPQLGSTGAAQLARAYADKLFTPQQVAGWLNAGLTHSQLGLMCELRSAGITPAMLSARLNGDTVLQKILVYGLSVPQLAAAMQRAGMLNAG